MHGRNHFNMQELHATREWKQATELLRKYQDDPTLELEL
jgi:hypothetical protein